MAALAILACVIGNETLQAKDAEESLAKNARAYGSKPASTC